VSMRVGEAEVSFEEFVYARPGSLLRTALLLTGQNRAEAEDLLQLALERAYRHWPRICRSGEPERYVRGILASASADRWRRLARRAERPLPATGAGTVLPDHSAAVADRDYLLRALAALSAGLVPYRNRRGIAADDVDRRAGRPVAVLIEMTVPEPVTA